MKTVVVGVPILKETRRFHFEKGRRWTIFEHMVLHALSNANWTIAELQTRSNLPRRVLIEILIRLMRVGWVQLLTSKGVISFKATAAGKRNAELTELPPVTKSDAKYIGFSTDQITGAVFRSRNLSTTTQFHWSERVGGRAAILLSVGTGVPTVPPANVREIANKLLEADEELISVEPNDERPRRRIALCTVRRDEIEGLGADVPSELRKIIMAAASEARAKPGTTTIPPSYDAKVSNELRQYGRRPIEFTSSDLILDGAQHKKVFEQVFLRARHRIILHSTFINLDLARAYIPMMRACAEQGTLIDILWGKSDNATQLNDTRRAAAAFKALLESEGVDDRIKIHQTSTRSHSKLILYDRGNAERFEALLGSCNWLSTGFSSFDATVKLRSPEIVADIAYILAELARPRDGQIPELTSDLVRLGSKLERMGDAPSSSASAQLVIAPEHAALLHQARDNAEKRATLLSHRLGVSAKPVLKALAASARVNAVRPEVYYGRVSGPVTTKDAAGEIVRMDGEGVSLTPIRQPRIHAKVLCWDDDDLVVTSLNWLSADPPMDNVRHEIGVHIHARNIANQFRTRFETARESDDDNAKDPSEN